MNQTVERHQPTTSFPPELLPLLVVIANTTPQVSLTPPELEYPIEKYHPPAYDPEVVLSTYLSLLKDSEFRATYSRGFVGGALGSLRNITEKLATKVFPNKNKAKFEQWNARTYLDLLAQPIYRNSEVLNSLLTQNFDAFAAEYTRGQLVWNCTYRFGEHGEILGVENSYQEDFTTSRLGNFSRLLAEQQKNTRRAEYEDQNMEKLKDWMSTAPLHSIFLWCSPPGPISEGYTGTHSHSFIFVYHKTEDRAASVYQFRTWMPLHQHAALQHTLGKAPLASKELSHSVIDNTLYLTPPAHDATLWAQKMISSIQTSIYAQANEWRVKPEDMPAVNEKAFLEMRDFLFSLYLRKVVPLMLEQTPAVASAQDPRWLAFLESAEYQQLITQMDTAFAVFAYQPLARFVEQTQENKQQSLLQKLRSSFSKKESSDILTVPQEEIEPQLHKIYTILLKDKVSAEEQAWFNETAPGFLSVSNRLLSIGQCGLGSFLPTQLNSLSLLEQSNLFQAIQMNQLNPLQLQQLVGAERFRLWKKDQTCVACSSEHVWVGECGVCLKCEQADTLGQLNLAGAGVIPETVPEFQNLGYFEQLKTKDLFGKLRKHLIVESASAEQIFLSGNIIKKNTKLPPALAKMRTHLINSIAPLPDLFHEVVAMVQEKSEQLTGVEEALQAI